jgi:hypothetical protein
MGIYPIPFAHEKIAHAHFKRETPTRPTVRRQHYESRISGPDATLTSMPKQKKKLLRA